MKQPKNVTEAQLRMARGGIQTAKSYITSIPSNSPALNDVVELLDEAVHWIVEFAKREEIELRDSMKT